MKIGSILILSALSSLFLSCEDVLDTKTVNEWDDNKVWKLSDLAQGVLMQAYSAIPNTPNCFDNNFLDAATDNAVTNSYGSGVYKAAIGGITGADNPIGNWDGCYKQMQNIHEFLEKGLRDDLSYDRTNPETDAAIKKRLEGEALFLRAWWGFALLQRYGGRTDEGEALGYPIITHFVTIEEAKQLDKFKRNTYQECVRQILQDCDLAMKKLPATYTGDDAIVGVGNIGRATSMAAAVLKSRVALYSASPAFQSSDTITLNHGSDYSVIDPEGYQKQWEQAALISNAVLQLQDFGKYTPLKANNIADAPTTTPTDFVFRSYFNTNGMEANHFPPFYRGTAHTVPSQNLVDAFPAIDGYPIGESAEYDPDFPYEKRDKRLVLNVYYQGRSFGDNNTNIDVVAGGKDSKEFHPQASRTGYYLAKFMSRKKDMLAPIQKLSAIHYNPLLRKSEVFLNFAEASNEAWGPKVKGPDCQYSAYDVLKMIRHLSGGLPENDAYLEEMSASKEQFRKLVQNERRLELAFENQRYFDMRRWLLPLDESVKGVIVTRDANGTLSYATETVEERKFNDVRFYYLPLPHAELLKNPNLKNNIGWDNN